MEKEQTNKNKFGLTIVILMIGFFLLGLGIILSISSGVKDISFQEVIKALFRNKDLGMHGEIIRDLRVPRALAAVLTGAFLASSGAVMQGITRNPIASPSIMGVVQGAAFAVALNMVFQPIGGQMGKVIAALLGASISAILIFLLSIRKTNLDITRMVLAGTALGTLFISLASVTAYLTNHTKDLAFWIAGSLSGATWEQIHILGFAAIGLLFALLLSPKITILSLGDEVAIGLGEKPSIIRSLSLLCIVLLTGAAAAIGGNIGFVCLIVPHIARLTVGSDYRHVIPVSIVYGGVILVYSDMLAKMLASPFEIPVGSITSLIGVPILIYLVRREK